MVNIQSPTAEIRQGIKKDRRKKPQGKNIMSASATQGGHNDNDYHTSLILSRLDTLHSRRKQLIQRFIDRIFLHSSSFVLIIFYQSNKNLSVNCVVQKNTKPYFGRPFVKWFALCYRTGVCAVLDFGVLWPNSRMD